METSKLIRFLPSSQGRQCSFCAESSFQMRSRVKCTVIITIYGKTFEREIFAFRVENGYSLENLHCSMLVDLYCQSTRPYLMGKGLRLSEKLQKMQKLSPSNVLQYTVSASCKTFKLHTWYIDARSTEGTTNALAALYSLSTLEREPMGANSINIIMGLVNIPHSWVRFLWLSFVKIATSFLTI